MGKYYKMNFYFVIVSPPLTVNIHLIKLILFCKLILLSRECNFYENPIGGIRENKTTLFSKNLWNNLTPAGLYYRIEHKMVNKVEHLKV